MINKNEIKILEKVVELITHAKDMYEQGKPDVAMSDLCSALGRITSLIILNKEE